MSRGDSWLNQAKRQAARGHPCRRERPGLRVVFARRQVRILSTTGTLTPGTSPVSFTGTADQLLTPGGATLYQALVNLPTAGANTLRLAGDLIVSNQLSLTSGMVVGPWPRS